MSRTTNVINNSFSHSKKIQPLLSQWLALAKFKIVILVVICALIGWLSGLGYDKAFDPIKLIVFFLGLSLLSGGSLALNQVQELHVDSKMKRTQSRPIVSGRMSLVNGFLLSLFSMIIGIALLLTVSVKVAVLGLLTVLLYNGLYTLKWKPRMAFAAVPGAIPGALPVVMGFAGSSGVIFNSESAYLFMILFLWQMPHFWALAIKYKEDYAKGGIPVLPVVVGDKRAGLHIGAYLVVYIVFALCAPIFTHSYLVYYFGSIPMSGYLLYTYFRYFKKLYEGGKSSSEAEAPKGCRDQFQRSNGGIDPNRFDSVSAETDFGLDEQEIGQPNLKMRRWLQFFLAVSLSLLVFLLQPLIDRWLYILINA